MTAPTTTGAGRPSRLSAAAIIAIAVVAMLVLAGVGTLIGSAAETETNLGPAKGGHRSNGGSHLGERVAFTASARTVGGPTPPSEDGSSSSTVQLFDTAIPVPAGFSYEVGGDGSYVTVWDDDGSYAFVNIYHPTEQDPTALLADLVNDWITQTTRTQVETSNVGSWNGITGAWQRYVAIQTDDNGSFGAAGEIDAVVRQNGDVMGIQLEIGGDTKQEAYDRYLADTGLTEILDGSVDSFAAGG